MESPSFNRRSFIKMTGLGAAMLSGPKKLFADNDIKGGRAEHVDYKGCDVLRVGLCQVYTEKWALEDNLKRTIAAIETAAKQDAEIAVTPECVLLGYPIDNSENIHQRLLKEAQPLDGRNLQLIRQKAKKLNIHILLGFAERDGNNKIYNSVALISNQGAILNVYRKVHCRANEDINRTGYFTPGDEFTVNNLKFDNRQFNVGTMICFDREIPEAVRCLRSLGAEIVFCPMAWYTYDMTKHNNFAHNEMLTRCRAAENELFIVVVSHAGRFNGGSFVVGPRGELLHQMASGPGIHVLDVPVGVIAKKFHSSPLSWMGWAYRKQAVYDKYLK
ncbi:MAG: carbon-nitrogen hydrolase family protein [Planctomycetota bacterium]|jgi:predicted amidohydrolase